MRYNRIVRTTGHDVNCRWDENEQKREAIEVGHTTHWKRVMIVIGLAGVHSNSAQDEGGGLEQPIRHASVRRLYAARDQNVERIRGRWR